MAWGWTNDKEYQAIERKLDALDRKLDALFNAQRKSDMATKQEVQKDLADIKQIVGETRGAANSAIVLLKKYIDQVNNAAANAADLDAFRADLKIIHDETLGAENDLKAAVETNVQA